MSARQKLGDQWIPMPTDQRWAVNLHFTDYFPGTDRWRMTLRLAFADGLPFGAPHRGLEVQQFRAPAYKRADIGMSFRAIKEGRGIQEPLAGYRLPEPIRYLQREQLLLGFRCQQPSMGCSQLPHRPTNQWKIDNRVLIFTDNSVFG